MTITEVKELMLTSSNSNEWNSNCDKVKAAFNGNYPSFWYREIILGGVYSEAQRANNW